MRKSWCWPVARSGKRVPYDHTDKIESQKNSRSVKDGDEERQYGIKCMCMAQHERWREERVGKQRKTSRW